MSPVLRHLLMNNGGALTPKYTIISGILASLIALSSVAIKLLAISVHASGI